MSGQRALCPGCGAEVVAKCGEFVKWHWAHVSGEVCDSWGESEGTWHRAWKLWAPRERREVWFGRHVADIVAGDGVICELQHSSISVDEIRDRERFYGNMRWLFDARDKGYELNVKEPNGNAASIHRSFWWPTMASCRKRVILDLGMNVVISLEHVNDSGTYGFGYIYPYRTIQMWIAGPSHWPTLKGL